MEQARALGLRVDDAESRALAQMLDELDGLFQPVGDATRDPSEDPFDFMRVVRELGERNER